MLPPNVLRLKMCGLTSILSLETIRHSWVSIFTQSCLSQSTRPQSHLPKKKKTNPRNLLSTKIKKSLKTICYRGFVLISPSEDLSLPSASLLPTVISLLAVPNQFMLLNGVKSKKKKNERKFLLACAPRVQLCGSFPQNGKLDWRKWLLFQTTDR